MIHLRLVGITIIAGFLFLLGIAGLQKRKRLFRQMPDIGDIDFFEHDDDDSLTVKRVEPDFNPMETSYTHTAHASYDHEKPKNSRTRKSNFSHLVLNIMAKKNSQFAGYELLQSLLSYSMRFGEMDIFHRHEQSNGNGKILFSLASVTEPGTFEIYNMGGFACQGLTMFMPINDDQQDSQTFDLMLETAEQLTNDLNGVLCDQQRRPLTKQSLAQYREKFSEVENSFVEA